MRLRFAPSPTGFLHLGGLRTALFNYLIARKYPKEGKFILRIEDTDRSRFVPGAIENLQRSLRWAGIDYDEGPDRPGLYGPYIQSQRLGIYSKYADEILDRGHAYRCFCSRDRLASLKTQHGHSHYDRICRSLPVQESKARADSGESFTVRFKIPVNDQDVIFTDKVFGPIKLSTSQLDDIVLMKTDKYPTYHFANIVDDHLMEIDLVMRGAEWIPSTPLHQLLYSAFEWKPPQFAHLPLLINPDGSKLSKRQDSAHVDHYIKSGFLPAAVLNFVAFLGWTPPRSGGECSKEILTMKDFINEFDLSRLNNSDATVNFDKLKWLNRQHIKLAASSPGDDLIAEFKELVSKSYPSSTLTPEYLKNVLSLASDRIFFLNDILTQCSYYFIDPDYENVDSKSLIESLKPAEISSLIENTNILNLSTKLQRLIITGCKVGPPIQAIIELLGEDTCRRRFYNFVNKSNLSK